MHQLVSFEATYLHNYGLLVHAELFKYFHNPRSSDTNYGSLTDECTLCDDAVEQNEMHVKRHRAWSPHERVSVTW